MKKVFVAVLGLMLAGSPVWAAALDGRIFSGTVGKMGSKEGQPDDFVFKDGKFSSTLCNKFGYGEGVYQPIENAGVVYFIAQCKKTDGGKKSWRGSVKGDNVEGTVTTLENGLTDLGWFKGQAKTS